MKKQLQATLQILNDLVPLRAGHDARAVAVGLHDIAAAIREHTAAIMTPVDEDGTPHTPAQYLDGTPIEGA